MIVFVDMDGVVADFDKHFTEIYGVPIEEADGETSNAFWNVDCVSYRVFANSPPIQEGLALVESLVECKVPFSFLTSTGGGKQHIDIAKQKLDFLQRYGMGGAPVAFATGTKCKASFASPNAVLIDDREKVVDAFRSGGGTAYLFTRDNWRFIADDCSRFFSQKNLPVSQ
jgi:hypothetical protein